jgi:hypothetical protein
MDGFLGVIALNVRYFPNLLVPLVGNELPEVRWIFTKWVARRLAPVRTLIMGLSRIFGGNPYCVQVEDVTVSFGKPEQRFVPTREPPRSVKTVLEVPNHSVPEFQTGILKQPVIENIERKYLALVNPVPDLPAQASAIG